MMDFWLMFVLGVVSSLHCIQMCGPIVLSYSAAAGFRVEKRRLGCRYGG
jgi:sulfite exporter TauE/SafE